ncbi:hypothetical protein BCBMB205_13500 [Bacillus sp. CN2]|nr:hypothetical protein BCBMB205_13500 [Bacillus velezensis]ARZ57682.1 hypothetical protein BAGQ_1448 [Bacillus velezensis]GFR53856.1 hypothetical protein BCBMB205_13500 [Bacillus sp. CN2]
MGDAALHGAAVPFPQATMVIAFLFIVFSRRILYLQSVNR